MDIKNCKGLAWLFEANSNNKTKEIWKDLVSCPGQGKNIVKCPMVIDEGLNDDELEQNALKTVENNQTEHAYVLCYLLVYL